MIGHGTPDPSWQGVTWIAVPQNFRLPRMGNALLRRARFVVRMGLGRLFTSLHGRVVMETLLRGPVYDAIRLVEADLYIVNDWSALPAVAVSAPATARVVFDAHEFAPLEWEHSAMFRWRDAPMIRHVLKTYGRRCDATVTVCQPIADRYAREYGFAPIVVRNVPALVDIPAPRARGDGFVRLVHHGGAVPARRLELMIHAVAAAEPRFTLTFMLVGDGAYIADLRRLAEQHAPGRVFFVDPVPPTAIAARIAEFDMGLFLLETRIYNYEVALPNKLFDFIMGGLAVCVGPSPTMAELVSEYGCGVVTPSLRPDDVARTLASIDEVALTRMRAAAVRARHELNAGREMTKVTQLVRSLLSRTA